MWTEVIFIVGRDRVEAWSDALLECGAASVQVEDADDGSPDEQAIFGEPGEPAPAAGWLHTRLAAMIGDNVDADELLSQAASACGEPVPDARELRAVPDLDWVRATQAQFDPIPVGERLWITPSWHLPDDASAPVDGRLAIVLDPGLAFGTGSHPTTRLCLQWLEANLAGGERVLDYGCGSGILAIAAMKLGAARAVGVDIDPLALEAARYNASANSVDLDVRAADAALDIRADLTVANILANPLRMLAPLLAAHTRPGGRIALSGILAGQSDEVMAAYAPFFDMASCGTEGGWVCLAGTRRPGA